MTETQQHPVPEGTIIPPEDLTIEQLTDAIRALTKDIDTKTEQRAKLRAALKKRVGEL